MRLFLASFFSLVFSIGVTAQNTDNKTWTLDECVDYAMENNLQVQSTALQAEINKNNLQTTQWNYAPNLSAFSNAGWNFGLNIDPVTNVISQNRRFTSSINLSTSWVIYDGGRKYNSIAQSNHDYLAALYDLEDVKNDVSLNVASAYLQILLNREILAVAQEQENITHLQVKRTEKLVNAGSAPKGDLLQFEAQLARDEQNTVGAQNTLMISRLQLANLLQLEDPDSFEAADPELDLPEAGVLAYKPGQIFETALEKQPNIKAAEERIESSEEAVEISQSGYLPTLSLQGQVASSYSDQIREAVESDRDESAFAETESGEDVFLKQPRVVVTEYQLKPFSDQFSDNINEFVGVNLSIPIFSRMQVKNNVQNSRIQYQLSQLQLEQEKNNLRQTIYQAHADAKASYNSYLAAEKSVAASRESFEYARERFELGAINQFDFENAKNSLASAQSEMLRAKFDYIFKVKVLEFYLTNQIKLQ